MGYGHQLASHRLGCAGGIASVESVPARRERQQPMNYAQYLADAQRGKHPDDPFFAWLSAFEVDRVSGLLPVAHSYGFPLPERKADAVFSSPDEQEEAPPWISSIQCEWWQEDGQGMVVGIRQCMDVVMGMDHFTWYRVPLQALIQRVGTETGAAKAEGETSRDSSVTCLTCGTPEALSRSRIVALRRIGERSITPG